MAACSTGTGNQCGPLRLGQRLGERRTGHPAQHHVAAVCLELAARGIQNPRMDVAAAVDDEDLGRRRTNLRYDQREQQHAGPRHAAEGRFTAESVRYAK
jgi:hypothetical protein